MFKNKEIFWIWVVWVSLAVITTVAIPEVWALERQPAAEVIAIVGDVESKSSTDSQFHKVKLKDSLYPQDQVRTMEKSRAKLWFKDETILMLGEKTTLDISQFQMDNQGRRQNALFKVLNGTMRFIVHKFFSGLPPGLEVAGVTAVLGVRGTDCIIEVSSPDMFLNIGNTPAEVSDLARKERISLPPRIWARVTPGQPITTGTITPFMMRQYIQRTQSGQTQLPENVGSPPVLPLRGPAVNFGNPLTPQDDQFRDLTSPSVQNQNQVQPPLPSIHHR